MKPNIGQGDTGKTDLLAGREKVSKDSIQIEAYGALDELTAWVGLLRSYEEGESLQKILRYILKFLPFYKVYANKVPALLLRIQDDLMRAQSHVAAAPGQERFPHLPSFERNRVEFLEKRLEELENELPPLKHFILAGGTPQAARYAVARTLCRRTERRLTTWIQESGRKDPPAVSLYSYVNRLSDIFFALERWVNKQAGRREKDREWIGRNKQG